MTHILVSSVLGRQVDPWGCWQSPQPKQQASDQWQTNDHHNNKKDGGQ